MAEINYFATNDQLFWLQHINLVMLKKLNTDFIEHSAIYPIEPSAISFLRGGGIYKTVQPQIRNHRT